jgi:FkbM family methyltransferase
MSPLDYLWGLGSAHGALHVIDVGANPIEGDAPYKGLLERGYARVTGFEPQAEAHAALEARKSEAETYLPVALGTGGRSALRLYRHSGFASVFEVQGDVAALIGMGRATRPTGQVEVETKRLDDIEAAPADYLKIDVQGFELDIISNGRSKLSQAVLIQTEVRFLPVYRDEPSFGDLDRELRAQGFMFHDFAFLKRVALTSPSSPALRRRSLRQVVDGDAFYIRDLTRVGGMTDAQLWRLAVLAEGVVGSPNLAVFALDHLAARRAVPADAAARYLGLLPPGHLKAV